MGYTQHELAQRSGVSYASVKRFEQTGDISLVHLLKLANVLNRLLEFDTLFKNDDLAEAMQVIAKRAKA
jgi:transcriptional regulator with XRE-family HTH domain